MDSKNIIHNLPFDEYCNLERLNNSGIKLIVNHSPFHYKNAERDETSSLVIGHAGHTAVLEPDEFESRYAVFPEGMTKTTKEGKSTWAELESSGKSILRFSEYTAAMSAAKAIRGNRVANELLADGDAEVTVLAEIDDVPTKIRIDYYRPDLGMLIDVKTSDDAGLGAFSRSIASYGYDIQAAFYLDTCRMLDLPAESFVFIVVENKAPYGVAVYEIDQTSIEIGREKYQRGLDIYRQCIAFDEWPGYPEEIQPISLPTWALRSAA